MRRGKSAVSMRVYDNGKLEKEEILEVAGSSHKTKASRKERKKGEQGLFVGGSGALLSDKPCAWSQDGPRNTDAPPI